MEGFRKAGAWLVAMAFALPSMALQAAEVDSTGWTERGVIQRSQEVGASPSVPSRRLTPMQTQLLAASLYASMSRCWDIPKVVLSMIFPDGKRPSVMLHIELDRKGNVVGIPTIADYAGPEEIRDVFAESALRAIRRCAPFSVAEKFPEYYESWKTVRMRFKMPE